MQSLRPVSSVRGGRPAQVMAELRLTARRLVERERARVSLVASALVRHRHLDAAALRPYGP